MGSVDKHSHEAEWLRGAACGGAGGVGEGLASSPKPATTELFLQQLYVLLLLDLIPRLRDQLPAEGHSLSLEETGRILLVLELRFLMAIVSFLEGKRVFV